MRFGTWFSLCKRFWRPAVLAGVLSVTCAPAFGDAGVWVKEDHFAQVNVACLQVYVCSLPNAVIHDSGTTVVFTPDKKVQIGTCSAGGGPPDSCNECISGPPTTPCTYTLAPKK